MADFTDRLITIITMQGAAQAASQLQLVEQAAGKAAGSLARLTQELSNIGKYTRGAESGLMAGFEGPARAAQAAAPPISRLQQIYNILGQRTFGLTRVAAELTGGLGEQTAAWVGLAGAAFLAQRAFQSIAATISQAMQQADLYSQSLTRALVLFGNAGRNASVGGLNALAMHRLAGAGIPETATLNLAGQMAERGFSPGRINTLLPALQEIEAGTGGRRTAQQAMEMFLRVLERPLQQGGRGGLGGSRGLIGLATQLGLNIRFSGNIENDLNRLTEAIHQKFGGVAEALASTASGVHLRLQQTLTAATARLGQVIEILMAPLMERLIVSLQGVINTVNILTNPSPQGGAAVGQTALDLALYLASGNNPLVLAALHHERGVTRALEHSGASVQQEQLDELRRIDANTQRVASLVAQSVFGQISSFTRGAMTYRELNMAISIRSG